MKQLVDIFRHEITLKSDKWIPYFDVYQEHFSKFVDKAPQVVEVGVQGGGSLQMWRSFFGPEATITGIDIDTKVLDHLKYYDSNTSIVLGDQASPEFWDTFLLNRPKIDVFIDDGGHSMNQQITTFNKVFPRMNDGGVYLCEDTHTSYWAPCGLNHYASFQEYAKKIIETMNYGHVQPQDNFRKDQNLIQICQGLRSASFYNSMVVFKKESPLVFVREVVNEP